MMPSDEAALQCWQANRDADKILLGVMLDECLAPAWFNDLIQAVGVTMSENGEAFTPKEEAEIRAELTVRDAWLAITEASQMFNDPIAREFVERQRDEILSMKTKLDFLASAIVSSDRSAA